MPYLSEETFEQVYLTQSEDKSAKEDNNADNNPGNNKAEVQEQPDDTADNDFEQNDLAYTGSGGE